jgi:hypothetical protein
MMDTSFADAVAQLEEEVDRACSRAQDTGDLSGREIAVELRRIAQGWEDAD